MKIATLKRSGKFAIRVAEVDPMRTVDCENSFMLTSGHPCRNRFSSAASMERKKQGIMISHTTAMLFLLREAMSSPSTILTLTRR